MKRLLPLLIFFAVGVSYACEDTIHGEGGVSIFQKRMTHFEKLDLLGNFKVIIKQSNSSKIQIITHKNLRDNLNIKLEAGKLSIDEKNPVGKYRKYDVVLYCEQVSQITAAGNTSVQIIYDGRPFYTTEFQLSENSSIKATNANVLKFKVSLTDHSRLTIQGKAKKLTLNSKQNTTFNGELFTVDYLNLFGTDNSTISLNVENNLSGNLSQNAVLNLSRKIDNNELQLEHYSKINVNSTP